MTGQRRIIEHIKKHCLAITNDYGALKEAALVQDSIGYRAITGSILQIGENINALSDEFVSNYAEIEWRRLVRMRNRIAHEYEDLEPALLKEYITLDVPVLLDFCKRYLESL